MSMSIEDCAIPCRPRPTPDTPNNVLQQFSMKGRVAVITGASDGIGFAAVEALAEAGADVALWYNTNDVAITKAERIASTLGVRTKAYQVQVSDPVKVQHTINTVVEDFGKLDVFVANAGVGVPKPILEQTLDDYRKQMSVNVDGVFYCAKHVGAVFKQQGFGNLIITSSMSAHIVNVPVDQPVYNASKACVTHLGKSLAREWREFARVNVVSPGFFDTKMGAADNVKNEAYRMAVLGRQGNVRELKGLFLYLASDASSYQTGSDVIIDGGYTLP